MTNEELEAALDAAEYRLPTVLENLAFVGGPQNPYTTQIANSYWKTWNPWSGMASFTYRITAAVGDANTASGTGTAGDANAYTAAYTANAGTAVNPATVNLPVIAGYNAVNSQKLPGVGLRLETTGAVTGQGTNGYYWSSVPSDDSNGYWLYFNTAVVAPVYANPYSRGYSVRCLRR